MLTRHINVRAKHRAFIANVASIRLHQPLFLCLVYLPTTWHVIFMNTPYNRQRVSRLQRTDFHQSWPKTSGRGNGRRTRGVSVTSIVRSRILISVLFCEIREFRPISSCLQDITGRRRTLEFMPIFNHVTLARSGTCRWSNGLCNHWSLIMWNYVWNPRCQFKMIDFNVESCTSHIWNPVLPFWKKPSFLFFFTSPFMPLKVASIFERYLEGDCRSAYKRDRAVY